MQKPYRVDRNVGRTLPWMPHVTGRFYGPQIGPNSSAIAGGTPALDQLYAVPIIVPGTATYTEIGVNVSLAAAGSTRLGIYNDGGAGYPTTLVLDAGTINPGTTGDKAIVISQSLTAGWYWLALVSSVATVRYHGWTDTFGWIGETAGASSATCNSIKVAHTFGALPSPFTGGGTPNNASEGNIRIWLKI